MKAPSIVRRVALAALFFLAFFLILPWPVQAQGTGTVVVRLQNGTPGAPPPAGVEVSLIPVQGTQAAGQRLTATTDAQGVARFEGVDRSLTYLASVTYQGILYSSAPPQAFSEGSELLELTVPVYETTDDPSSVRLSQAHLIVSPDPDALHVAVLMVLENGGDRAYVGRPDDDGQTTTFAFPLPSGTEGVALDGEIGPLEARVVGGELRTSAPVPPGTVQWLLQFNLPASGSTMEFSFLLPLDAGVLSVFVPDVGAQVEVKGLAPQEPVTLQGTTFLQWRASGVVAETPVTVRVSGLDRVEPPPASTPEGDGGGGALGSGFDQPLPPGWVGWVPALLLALVLAAVWVVRR